MNNFIRNINDNNQIALMLVYGENGSFIPVDVFYLDSTFHCYSFKDRYELKGFNTMYYTDEAHFLTNDNKLIVLKAEDCVKLFEKYVSVNEGFPFDNINLENFSKYEKIILNKYYPYTLDDLNAYYDNGQKEMGRNYSLIPVVINYKDKGNLRNYPMEKYADFNVVRKLRKKANVNRG